jgi:hypothetical protein
MDANILSYIHLEDSMRRLFFTVVAVSLLLVCSTESSYSVAPDAKSTGTAIGTAINSAVTTAFPGIMSIVNAIWPNKASDKKTKTDATNSPSVQDLQKNAVQGLQDLKKISSDLDVVTLFISNTVAAENSVIAMRTMLEGKTSLSNADKLQLNDSWNPAKEALASLKNSDAQINALQDPALQNAFRALAKAAGIVDNITAEINAGTPGRTLLSKNLATLDGQLSAVNALSGEIIEDISFGLKQTVASASGKQDTTTLSPDMESARANFQSILKSRLGVQ